ncbi:MAG: ChbG/HpnK family deacetylase [Pseudomonadota bacterium]
MTTSTSKIIINADDIGMHPSIDAAVTSLCESGIVTSASVMALARPERASIARMASLGVDLGLHLDFTSAMANRQYRTDRTVASTIVACWSGRISLAQARAVVRDQLERFGELTGRAPAFVDGHEHVHQFPVIRHALLDVLAEQPGPRIYIRSTRPLRWRGIKAEVIGRLGAGQMNRMARHAGHRCNDDFFGVYNLNDDTDLAPLWQRWLACVPARGALAMCHPAGCDNTRSAGELRQRLREFRFLASAQFRDMLAQNGVVPAGWSTTLPAHG